MSDLGRVRWPSVQQERIPAPLRLCLSAFIFGQRIPAKELLDVSGSEVLGSLRNLGLVRPSLNHPDYFVCPVWVYPLRGFVLASDRRDEPEGGSFTPAADVVFPAIYGGTLRFLELLPATGGPALDLCGGSGIGAMYLSRTGAQAVTTDITERSTLFAEFNARLNNVPVESLCGDLYTPVIGRSFDLITAHPPFVPASGDNMIYRDAGDTGEEITRRIIQGLPEHLRPGGTCMILCVARDAADGPLEKRVQHWLAPCLDEFDIIFGREKTLSIEDVVESVRHRGQGLRPEEASKLLDRLRALGTERFVYGALFIRRLHGPAVSAPLRVTLAAAARANDFERIFGWRRQRRDPEFASWLVHSRPRLARELELRARYHVKDGELVPAEFVFSVERGLETALRVDGWVVPLIARLVGKDTVRELFEQARSAGETPPDFTLPAFGELLGNLLERGFLEVDGTS